MTACTACAVPMDTHAPAGVAHACADCSGNGHLSCYVDTKPGNNAGEPVMFKVSSHTHIHVLMLAPLIFMLAYTHIHVLMLAPPHIHAHIITT